MPRDESRRSKRSRSRSSSKPRKSRKRKRAPKIVHGGSNMIICVLAEILCLVQIMTTIAPYWIYSTEIFTIDSDLTKIQGLYQECNYLARGAELERGQKSYELQRLGLSKVLFLFLLVFQARKSTRTR